MSVWFVTGASRGFCAEEATDSAALEDPPLRIRLGSDAVARVEAKLDFVRAELDRWRKVSLSTDHDDV